jgi:archaellum biogenesis protein FlaJ (TadC family)
MALAAGFAALYSSAMFENKQQPLIPQPRFVRRLTSAVAISGVIAAAALAIGVLGYHYFGDLQWIDALHNASMILGGMGPVAEMKSDAAKLFSSAYALFCGLVFISVIAVTLVPIMHRILHKFHVDESDLKK